MKWRFCIDGLQIFERVSVYMSSFHNSIRHDTKILKSWIYFFGWELCVPLKFKKRRESWIPGLPIFWRVLVCMNSWLSSLGSDFGFCGFYNLILVTNTKVEKFLFTRILFTVPYEFFSQFHKK